MTIFETGSCVLNAKYITEIIRKLEGDRVEIELADGNLVKIVDQKSNFSLNSINVNEFPFIDFSFSTYSTAEEFKKELEERALLP